MVKSKVDQVFEEIINKMLEKHNLTYQDIVKTKRYYEKYTMTKQEEADLVKWSVALLRKKLRWSKYRAESQMMKFICYYGLKIEG